MSEVVVIGDEARVRGYGLVGARVVPAVTPEEARAAWASLPEDPGLVILSPEAADALGEQLASQPWLVWTVMPS